MSSTTSQSRHKARQRAFQVLYGMTFDAPDAPTTAAHAEPGSPLRRAFVQSPHPTEQGPILPPGEEPGGFAWELVAGVWTHKHELDQAISRFSSNWRVERIARIELTIIRLALFELKYRPDIPAKVTINEAIELAKSFGDATSRSFVNGILDAAAKAYSSPENSTDAPTRAD